MATRPTRASPVRRASGPQATRARLVLAAPLVFALAACGADGGPDVPDVGGRYAIVETLDAVCAPIVDGLEAFYPPPTATLNAVARIEQAGERLTLLLISIDDLPVNVPPTDGFVLNQAGEFDGTIQSEATQPTDAGAIHIWSRTEVEGAFDLDANPVRAPYSGMITIDFRAGSASGQILSSCEGTLTGSWTRTGN